MARLKVGDWGALPIFIGLAALALLFGTLDSNFYTERNFVNLLLQMSGYTAIAMGVVFVLLIAEIDLSVAFVSGVGGRRDGAACSARTESQLAVVGGDRRSRSARRPRSACCTG